MSGYYDSSNTYQNQYNQGNEPYQQPYSHNQYDHSNSFQARLGVGSDPYNQNQYDQSRSLNAGYGSGNQQSYQSPSPGYSNYNQHDQPQYNASQQYQQYDSSSGYGQNTWTSPPLNPQAPSFHQSNSDYYNQHPSAQENHYPSQSTGDRGYNQAYQPYPGADPSQVYPQHGVADQHQPGDERGILGAVGGAVVGGYAGHKVNHGFLGAVGGAIAGHKLEEHVKDKKKKKKHSSHGHSSSSSSSDDEKKKKKYGTATLAGATGAAAYAHHQHQKKNHGSHGHARFGNFSVSCDQITLDRDYDLIASCESLSGKNKLSGISLNDYLGNADGHLVWQRGGNFRAAAKNARLVSSGRGKTILEADMKDNKGKWKTTQINLDERIENNDGDLQYSG